MGLNILHITAIICFPVLRNTFDDPIVIKASVPYSCVISCSFLFSRLLPVRVPLLQRVSGEGGHHQQPGRVSDHLVVLLLLFFPLLRGQVPQRGRGHPLPVPGARVAEVRS